ncbi:hypothetical protein T552_01342 [Pneumocystis carinii B80]|uniref:Uncharacterized protein n=1 Tax=Pneumocystis carinii (strain B80) TaxID=1408658 RepID=A0A0W4ZLY3_PNEC8|nr:hypothetical protein T552_01342 [Pneumocystis carinii B80]KTW29389.1 hypothetical protein T552_01342 [Pneumocystis carinii B80]
MSTTVKEKNESSSNLLSLQTYFERIPSIINAPSTSVFHLTNYDTVPIFTTCTSTVQFKNLTSLTSVFCQVYEMISRLQLGKPKRIIGSYFSLEDPYFGAELVQVGCTDDRMFEREMVNSMDGTKGPTEIEKVKLPLIASVVGTKGTMASIIDISKEIEKVAQIIIKNWH